VKPPTIKNKPHNCLKPDMSNHLQSISAVCPSVQLAVSPPVTLCFVGWMGG